MQNILLTAKGVLKIGSSGYQFNNLEITDYHRKADFGMARAYSHRPLTPGVSHPFRANPSHIILHLELRRLW